MDTTMEQAAGKGGHGAGEEKQLHIFVNRRKFDDDRVKPIMKGREIAALVGVPPEKAVVRRETGPHQGLAGINDDVEIHMADHFLVTRDQVQGGHRG